MLNKTSKKEGLHTWLGLARATIYKEQVDPSGTKEILPASPDLAVRQEPGQSFGYRSAPVKRSTDQLHHPWSILWIRGAAWEKILLGRSLGELILFALAI